METKKNNITDLIFDRVVNAVYGTPIFVKLGGMAST